MSLQNPHDVGGIPPVSTLPLHTTSAAAEARTVAAPRTRSRAFPVPLLFLWDLLLPLALFALTRPLAGIGLFDERFRAEAIGPLDSPALVMAVVAPLGLIAVGALAARPGRRYAIAKLWPVALASVLVVWAAAAVSGWSLDLAQVAAVTLLLPFGWQTGRWALGLRRRGERVLVIGTGRVARHLLKLSRRHPERGMDIVGCLDDDPLPMGEGAPPVLGGLDDLSRVLDQQDIDRVIVSFSLRGDEEIMRMLRACDAKGVDVDVVPRLFDLMGPGAHTHSLGGLSLIGVRRPRLSMAQRLGKRAFDVIGSGVLLLVAAPVLAAVSLAIRMDDGKPVLYRQARVGRNGKVFQIVKFRTMVVNADEVQRERVQALVSEGLTITQAVDALKLERDPRLTRLGGFLRRTSLDELPQLLNVLRGDMSLVGPRPIPTYEAGAVDGWQLARNDVRPGITGLWQVSGRSEVRWEERMQLDYTYARHWSLAYDLKILAKTVSVVFSRGGAF